MTYADVTERQALISGLRELADFLESNPEVPAPGHADVMVFPPHGSDAEKRHYVDVIASLIGSGIKVSPFRRHYTASRRFGLVEYSATAIPSDESKEQ